MKAMIFNSELISYDEVTAISNHVLDGKTFINVNGNLDIGTMINRTNLLNEDLGGSSSTYPNLPVHKPDVKNFSTTTKGIRVFNVAPPKGYYEGNGTVYVGCEAIDKTVTPTKSTQTINASNEGKVLENITINPIPDNYMTTTDTTAGPSDIFIGQTAYTNGRKITGTMPDQGKKTSNLNAGQSYTIPRGYHNGQGAVTANSLSSQTSGTATAPHILSGNTAWINGVKITGTMANRDSWPKAGGVSWDTTNKFVTLHMPLGAYITPTSSTTNYFGAQAAYTDKTVTPGATTQTVGPDSGKVLHNVTVSAVSNLSAGNIKTGVTVGGVAGTYKGAGNAGTGDVLSGKTFSTASLSNATGTMTNQGAKTASLNCGGSYTIPRGYHNGSGKVTANSLSSQTSATVTAAQILTGKTAWVNGSKVTGTMADRRTLDSNIGGINSSYPGVSVQKGTALQFNPTTKGIRYGAMSGPTGFYENETAYVGLPAQSKTITPSTSSQTVSANSGYMLEKVTVNAIPNNRGQYQYGTGIGERDAGSSSGYYAINGLPEGYYVKNGEAWAPEARINADKLRQYLGVAANKIKRGTSICHINGTVDRFYQYTGTTTSGNVKVTFKDMNGNSVSRYKIAISVNQSFVPIGIACFTNGTWPCECITQDPWHIITFCMDTSEDAVHWYNYGGGNGIKWGGDYNIVVPAFFASKRYDYVLCGYLN